jgi:hypothetical protein
MNAYSDPNRSPRPEDLAAYLDGELDEPTAACVQRWLSEHPEELREIEGQRRLLDLWRTTRPSEPAEAAWQLSARRVGQPALVGVRRRPAWYGSRARAYVMTAAAACLLAALIIGPPRKNGTGSGDQVISDFSVVSSNDLEFISVRPDDDKALVIGKAPTFEPFEAALASEVRIRQAGPEVRYPADNKTALMIIAPK